MWREGNSRSRGVVTGDRGRGDEDRAGRQATDKIACRLCRLAVNRSNGAERHFTRRYRCPPGEKNDLCDGLEAQRQPRRTQGGAEGQ